MSKIEKQHWPLLLLLAMTATSCFYCIEDKKQAALKALIYASLLVLLGSYLIPEANKYVWNYLESGRFVVIALFVAFELITMMTVFIAIKSSLDKTIDPDLAISNPIESFLGQGKLAAIMSFEARAWVYAFFHRRVNISRFRGDQHFYGHLKDGTESNLLGFIILILIEVPLLHLLLHFIWSPFAANIISALTAFSLLFLVAEYRAISRRPVSIDAVNKQLIIRYGLSAPLIIPFGQIGSIAAHQGAVARGKNIKRYNQFGDPNVAISTSAGQQIYLGLNNPKVLIEAIQNAVKPTQPSKCLA